MQTAPVLWQQTAAAHVSVLYGCRKWLRTSTGSESSLFGGIYVLPCTHRVKCRVLYSRLVKLTAHNASPSFNLNGKWPYCNARSSTCRRGKEAGECAHMKGRRPRRLGDSQDRSLTRAMSPSPSPTPTPRARSKPPPPRPACPARPRSSHRRARKPSRTRSTSEATPSVDERRR
ncbi:hypothetical protein FKP32DRAFT_1136465 [Trametes sanguinea]|nr:hypothetical protein FKP32DRAFT_1136465 [Trametes sanguinea]